MQTCRPRLTAVFAILALWSAILILWSGEAVAHRSNAPARNDGVAIPTLTHGQMMVVAPHFGAIRALADRVIFDDLTFRKLNNYINLQYAACLWGLIPGSLTDEDSPFNECSHGYLSAAQALLRHMKSLKTVGVEADLLYDQISLEMLMSQTAAVLCRYSDEPFNSADVESPHWSDIPNHRPSLIAFAGLFSIPLFAVYFAMSRQRRG